MSVYFFSWHPLLSRKLGRPKVNETRFASAMRNSLFLHKVKAVSLYLQVSMLHVFVKYFDTPIDSMYYLLTWNTRLEDTEMITSIFACLKVLFLAVRIFVLLTNSFFHTLYLFLHSTDIYALYCFAYIIIIILYQK